MPSNVYGLAVGSAPPNSQPSLPGMILRLCIMHQLA